jgi:DNA-binding NtrC family response regulator
MNTKLLLVDDDPTIRFNIQKFFSLCGFEVFEASTCSSAVERFASVQPEVAVIDCFLPDGEGIELVSKFKELDPSVAVIVLTGHESIDLAIRAIKAGAEQFLTKPVDLPALLTIIKKSLGNQQLHQRQAAEQLHSARNVVDPFVGTSKAVKKLAAEAEKALHARSTVLLLGETGSGKGVLARWLYDNGPRSDGPFVDVNCAGLGKDLLESELFGHERGAFTGAVAKKTGLMEFAHHGMLFLDEIGDVDISVQPKLLKVIEEKRFRRLGDVRERQVDVQLIAATHANLEQLVGEKRFREDLYFRISAVPLLVPALRSRLEDIPTLAEELLRRLAADLGCGTACLEKDAQQLLQKHFWPGNIRELRNVLERAVLLSGGAKIGAADIHFSNYSVGREERSSDATNITLQEAECRHIENVLRAQQGQVEDAARVLGISRSAMYQKIRKHKIRTSQFNNDAD